MILKDNFSNYEEFTNSMSLELAELWEEFQQQAENGFSYTQLNDWLQTFEPYGLIFSYDLDAEPYEFQLIIN